MEYVQFNIEKELRKAAKGKKTKVEVGLLLCSALRDYPVIKAHVMKAFNIGEHK
jgi:hypothetical protein